MAKQFLETFPGVKFDQGKRELLEHVQVQFINRTKEGDIRVYIESDRLIPKKEILKIENQIKEQLFATVPISVVIFEKFTLSGLYTLEKLIAAYKESILMDFDRWSVLEANLMRKAKWKVEGDSVLSITFPEGPVVRSRAGDMRERLEKILNDRCGAECTVDFQYEVVENKKRNPMDEVVYMEARPEKKEEPVQEKKEEKTEKNFVPGDAKKGTLNKKGSRGEKTETPARPRGGIRRSDNPAVIYGRDFNDDAIPISEIQQEMGEVTVRGKILSVDSRELRNGEKTIVSFAITDFTDTITSKIFVPNENLPEIMAEIAKGKFIQIKGMSLIDKYDKELGISSVVGIKKSEDTRIKRVDNAPVKRVELHCHSKMSEMDGVAEIKDLVGQAEAWGHPALALTDHGVTYGFPVANHSFKNPNFKMIYGVEGYLVDDLKELVTNGKGQDLECPAVIFDIETTGFSPINNNIIEIGAVKMVDGEVVDRFSAFVNPKEPIPFKIEQLTGIDDSMVMDAPDITEVLPKFLKFCEGCILVAHNAGFDVGFIKENARRLQLDFNPTYLDTVSMARVLLPNLSRFKLDHVAKELNVTLENHHRAVDDAEACAGIYKVLKQRFLEDGVVTLKDLDGRSKLSPEAVKKLPTYHIIILAKNEVGRTNLYKLVSYSHINYYSRRPRIPKSELMAHREGLIIGSACEAGELFRALLRGESDAELSKIADFYDYLEIQPIGNNRFLLGNEEYGIETERDLQNLNRKVVELGDQLHKPVVATCDVHFLNPEDEVYRRIIMAGQGFSDADNQAPLFLRTTEEMLSEFQYLGSEKAEEVVITNTNLIADQIEKLSPVRPDKCPPVIENSDQDLRDMCYKKAIEMYGDPIPEIVKNRLDRELNSIISNGYSVMYIIAQKLVLKSNQDGYLVGSRGSVGSSLAATMSGITEVNPLKPHYYCSECHYNEFDSEDVNPYAGGAGCDMPDKNCPNCGRPLIKAGFDIPFETFLGFKGNKEPDIDLNFSGEYQSHAHDFTEVIFGKGHTFRAGTIGTLADKTAFGYVKNYFEERGQDKRYCEIDRVVQGLVGVRRSSGQHPGGIIVLPHGEEIYTFTPVQRPANDMTTKTVTTHFDYHSIDHNLLKLDILGHDDPTMIRMLGDLIPEINMTEIPLDSKEVMSLFQNTSALGVKPEDIHGCRLGALGIPEFGTDFAMQMLIDAKPTKFSDLVRIAGLSHGTDVWLGNAQTLLQEGKATIDTAICTRDDIMIYLISMGMDSEESFTIMESVRKGKGLKPDWEAHMVEAGVPDWYIWSCKKIKYMFPKAHAAAYVMMAWRIAYCKIFYPLAYYAAFFSIRATAFSYELMCLGKAELEKNYADYQKRSDTLSKKEQDTFKDMRIVQEMYARGYDFMPIDIYRAKATRFQIIDGKIMPSLTSIEGMGEKAAEGLEEAAKLGKFLSKDDLRTRAKISKTVVDKMSELGLLKGLPESNQLSLFDF